MTRFAENTEVSVEKSRAELDTLLSRYKATQRITAIDEPSLTALVGFTMNGLQIRMRIPLPSEKDFADPLKPDYQQKDRKCPQRWHCMTRDQRVAWVAAQIEQANRTRWRGILLVCKAKLELVEMGLSTVDREFLADIALPEGGTVGDLILEQIANSYKTGTMPPLLGMGPPKRGEPIEATFEDPR